MKPVTFLGDSLEELRSFPQGARRAAGVQLDKVQRGLMPANWKPTKTVGPGVCEIRVKDESGIYRVLYIATFAEAVLCCTRFGRRPKKRLNPIWSWQKRD
jgi:phage-related protein